jgi:hypothetical protein
MKITNKLKTNTSGFGHIEMLLVIVAVVIIGAVGFFVYQNHNKKTATKSTAHAGAWTNVGSSNLVYGNGKVATTVSVFACASPVKSGNTISGWKVDWGYTSSKPSVVLQYESSVTNWNGNYIQNDTTNGTSSGSWYITPAKILPENFDYQAGGYLTIPTTHGSTVVFIKIGGFGLWTGLGTPQADMHWVYVDQHTQPVNLASC